MMLYNKGIKDLNIFNETKEEIKKYIKANKDLLNILMIVTNFRIMMFSGNRHKLDKWLEKTEKYGYKEINKFIKGVKKDYEAVANAVEMLDSSNAKAEGKITKLKVTKRIMYGRCSFNHLRSIVFLKD